MTLGGDDLTSKKGSFSYASSPQFSCTSNQFRALQWGMAVESETTTICDLLNLLVRAIVTDKEAVEITIEDPTLNPTVIQIKVAQGSDLGKVIGKQGRTARSLRIIFHAITKELRSSRNYQLNIVDKPNGCP
jgi:predicted RNA-binding protein YlqC (UPF0109 family)